MNPDIFNPSSFLIKQICKGSSDNLKILFNKRIELWKYPYIHNETYTLGSFGDLTQTISSQAAFHLIPTAIEIACEQVDKDRFITALSLAHALIIASNTTELNEIITSQLAQLKRKAHAIPTSSEIDGYFDNINSWYRVSLL